MPRMTDAISVLKVDGKTYKNPEWWNTKHKLTKNVKKTEKLQHIKANSLLNSSYEVITPKNISVTEQLRKFRADLDNAKYAQFAPWNPVFVRKFSQLILFKK